MVTRAWAGLSPGPGLKIERMHGLDLIDYAPRSYNTKYGVQRTKNLTIRYTRERKKNDIIELP